MKLGKYWPVAIFFIFFSLIIGANLYYAPSWGLRDDFQRLGVAYYAWHGGSLLRNLWDIIWNDLLAWGIFRPVFHAWAVFTYHIFRNFPLLIYVFIAIFNFLGLLLWGAVIRKLFSSGENNSRSAIFIFPLSFFIFTPFWSVFAQISLQEKFILFFSALSLYFLEKSFSKNRTSFLILSVFSMLLGILSKPTGIYLPIAYIFFAVVNLLFFKYKKRISLWLLLLNILVFFSYYFFVVHNLRGYSSKYELNFVSVINNILNSSIVIKLLIVISLAAFFSMSVIVLRKKNWFSPLAVIIPLCFLAYILVLSPWNIVNYLLSPLAPYVLGMFFPVYLWFNCKEKKLKFAFNFFLVILVASSFFFIAIPRISKLSDIRDVEKFLISFNKNNNLYFFPPPFAESAEAVAGFTSTKIIYLGKGILNSEMLNSRDENYLILNDEASPVTLDGVKPDEEIYNNNTWRILHIIKSESNRGLFKVDFPQNFAEKLKSFLRDLH